MRRALSPLPGPRPGSRRRIRGPGGITWVVEFISPVLSGGSAEPENDGAAPVPFHEASVLSPCTPNSEPEAPQGHEPTSAASFANAPASEAGRHQAPTVPNPIGPASEQVFGQGLATAKRPVLASPVLPAPPPFPTCHVPKLASLPPPAPPVPQPAPRPPPAPPAPKPFIPAPAPPVLPLVSPPCRPHGPHPLFPGSPTLPAPRSPPPRPKWCGPLRGLSWVPLGLLKLCANTLFAASDAFSVRGLDECKTHVATEAARMVRTPCG